MERKSRGRQNLTGITGLSAPWFAAVKRVESWRLEFEFNCVSSDLSWQYSEVGHAQAWHSSLSKADVREYRPSIKLPQKAMSFVE